MKPHAFIAMPFGTKADAEGHPIDFNAVYEQLLKPALEDAGCEVFRADEEQRAGDIRADMFQELLVADLVLADLTIDNPNVWYELGVRHALRARGVVLVQGPRKTSPFDIYTDRKIRYALKGGMPDPAMLAADRAAIAAMARETLESSTRRKVSPVYVLLPHLQQPQWRALLLEGDNEFGAAHRAWSQRMEVARRQNRAGDILLLAGEAPVRALAADAHFDAGRALLRLQQAAFALEQFDAALGFEPAHLGALQHRPVCLTRLLRHDEAREAARALVDDVHHKEDAECWALVGRVEKDEWVHRWRPPAAPTARAAPAGSCRTAAAAEDALLANAIAPYRKGFRLQPGHLYSGINALTLSLLRGHLGGDTDAAEIERLVGGLRWALTGALDHDPQDYWVRATNAELTLLAGGSREAVVRDWKAALAASARNAFALDSSYQTLLMLWQLGFRSEETGAAAALVEAERDRLDPPFSPRQVLWFSGHRVDEPARAVPRFPPSKVGAVEAAIERMLEQLDAGPGDLALTQGAAGGDLLFSEVALRRGLRVQWLQPLPEAEFIQSSVMTSADGPGWRERYFAVKAKLAGAPRCMLQDLGPAPKGVNRWERCNQWLLHTAMGHGPERVRSIHLWDGRAGDGPGGTQHSYETSLRRAGHVYQIDISQL